MRGLLGLTLLWVVPMSPVWAQSDLLGADQNTVVQRVTFSYTDTDRYVPQFTVSELRAVTTTRAIPKRFRLRRLLGRAEAQDYRLDPIELQRDVVRLREAFREAGYLHTHVDYGTSTLNRTSNTARIRFNVTQGPPVIIQDVGFYSEAGYLAQSLDPESRAEWIDFRDRTSFEVGDIFTHFGSVQIEDAVLSWLKDQGYAFAELNTSISIDSVYNAADIVFLVDTGPLGYIHNIEISGAPGIGRQIVHRALSLERGDLFSQRALIEGQRALFSLGLFSVVQVDTPPQVRDSTVDVRVNLQRARPRHISAETGYHQRQGVIGEGRWIHRNFWGGGADTNPLHPDADRSVGNGWGRSIGGALGTWGRCADAASSGVK